MKKLISLILILLLGIALAACNGSVTPSISDSGSVSLDESSKGDTIEPDSKHIVAWIWNTETDDFLINEFIRDNPEYTVDHSVGVVGVWGDRSLDLPKLAAALASGEQPDLFMGWMKPIEAFYTDMFMPIDQYFELDTNINKEDFDPNIFTLTSFNDEVYFLPFDFQGHIFAWSKDIFEKAGLDPDIPPTTWSEYLDFARRATIKRPSGALQAIGAEQMHFRWDTWHIVGNGYTFVDPTGLNFNWSNPSYVEIFEYNRSLAETYGGNELLGGANFNFVFFQNVAMFSAMPGSALRTLATWFDTEVGIGKIPIPDGATEYYSTHAVDSFLGIPRTAKNPKGGWKLMTYAITQGFYAREIQYYQENPNKYSSEYISHLPTRERLYNFIEPLLEEELIDRMKLRDELTMQTNVPYYVSPVHTDIDKYINENIVKMYNFEITPQDFALQLQDYSESLLDEFIQRKTGEGWTFGEHGGIPPQR